ncbi:OmpA family protein [Neolewinella lacunae]|uniref:PD40 domain-containing protein n=1 Tax=Neolewinella lacunae TaxID=1517758 RepID=A0A923TA14_9BACT|nr:OmpA family protein [Neolewinella lacunae]MBC6995668.1 PD40 domain-containing protein [Neolewinella lacunae]MDN3634265.1 OmpA family protein [Neolewinella lacunae]
MMDPRPDSRRRAVRMATVATLWVALGLGSLLAQGTLLTAPSNNGEIEIENCARINGRETEFGPAIYGSDLVFLTRPKRGSIDPVTKQTYFKLFRAPLSPDGVPGYPSRFSVELNSNYNEGPVSFTQDDRVIYFTRTQLRDGVSVADPTGKANLGIYSAYRAEYDWADVRPMPFNGANFSNQHPALTPDGRRIYFASNRNGGYGGYDLYFSDYHDGRWSPAINLGPEINTEGNEAFPYIHPSGRLFFASDGHGGLGGYDLFLIDLSQRRWGKVINLPAPVNSSADDVGITLTNDAARGYLVSNRAGGKGKDDIYLLRFARGFASLRGPEMDGEVLTIYDGSTSQRVAGAEVWLGEVDPAGRLPAPYYSFQLEQTGAGRSIRPVVKPMGQLGLPPLRSDREGNVRLELATGKTYEVHVAMPGYAPETLRFLYTAEGPSRLLAITLQPTDCVLLTGRLTDSRGAGAGNVPLQFRPIGCTSGGVSAVSDLSGYYEVCLRADCGYLLSAGRLGFATGVAEINADQLRASAHPRINLALQPEGLVTRRGTDADAASLALPAISFYSNTAILQEELSRDLDILVQLLRDRPDIQLRLIAHTDGREAADQLVLLGDNRAEAVRQALIRRGIAPDRLRTLSYGNRFRLRNCLACTEEDYALNNRLEARVIGEE